MDVFKRYKLIIIFAILASLSLLFFSFYTNQVWDDFFITFRYSKNLAEGKGAVYNPNERVYGFTSPLEMFLLSSCYLITGKNSYLPSLWLYRVICIAAFIASGILLLLSISDKNKKTSPAAYFLAAFYILETKSIAFSVNGMETAFTLLFLSLFIFLACKDLSKNWIAAGVSWAGLLLARPDGCIYIICLSLGYLIFSRLPKKQTFIALLKAGSICTLLYLPWMLWAWNYYGSPIPNTIQAKSRLIMLRPPLSIYNCIFGPVYVYFGGWPFWINIFTSCLGLFTGLYWTVPSKDKLGRTLSFSFFLLYFYYLFLPRYPWYYPAATIISLVVLSKAISIVKDSNKIAAIAVFTIILSGMIYIFASTAWQLRIQQKEIENGNRKQIGLWLKENVRPNESVYLEPLGYIGYFSGSKMIDYPGLISGKVVRLLHENKGFNFHTILPEIKPDWVILRPRERDAMSELDYFKKNYKYIKTFDVTDNLGRYKFIPGAPYLLYDSVFSIFKKINNP
ncbi:MAG: hypothetical protein ABIH75_02275 [Candidatus Omnitrophota bacterium]